MRYFDPMKPLQDISSAHRHSLASLKVFVVFVVITLGLTACSSPSSTPSQMPKNTAIQNHTFLQYMTGDPYFPDFLVEKGVNILLELCTQIEAENPADLKALYVLTHAATDRFNDLDEELSENGSEIETVARENIATDMDFIAKTYGFDADMEELIANRDW